METRIPRIETDIAHLRSDITDMKTQSRRRFDELDVRVARVQTTLDELRDRLADHTRSNGERWLWVASAVVTVALFGAMWHGFGWI